MPGIEWVAMTTNGLVLTRRLPAYQRAGLDALNISLDSLQPERYEKMARRPVGSFSVHAASPHFTCYVPVELWSSRALEKNVSVSIMVASKKFTTCLPVVK